MKLHHSPLSSSSRRVTLTARILGIELEHNLLDLRDQKACGALIARNPNSKIPVLEDGDFVLWESHAIMSYLCARTPGQTLAPTETRARADLDRWLFWSSAHLSVAVGGLGWENIWKKMVTGEGPDAEQVKRHEILFHQFATVLDNHLATRTWISGPTLSLADLSIAATLMYGRAAKLPLASYAHILAYQQRVAALDAWQRTEPPAFAW